MTPEEILEEQNIDYSRRGADLVIKCLNPEHEDNNPSMRVDAQTGIFHCFTCKARGNLFTKYSKIANTLGLKQQSIIDLISMINQPAMDMPIDYQPFLEEYRNIKPETFKHFNMFTSETLSHSRFEGRITMPIKNFRDKIVGFIGRYKYSKIDPKYLIYPSNLILPLFPDATRIEDNVIILVEGMFDMFNLYDKGLTNVITGFGLVSPSKKDKYNAKLHERFLPYKIAGINKLVIVYDGDKAGRTAASKLEMAMEDFMAVQVIELPDDLDPGKMNQRQVDKLKGMIYANNKPKEEGE